MIIKIIPEKEGEGPELVYENVQQFFLCGKALDEENSSVEFQEWRGSHRYLMGSLNYFYNVINDERTLAQLEKIGSKKPQQVPMQQVPVETNNRQRMIKRGEVLKQDVREIDITPLVRDPNEMEDDNEYDNERNAPNNIEDEDNAPEFTKNNGFNDKKNKTVVLDQETLKKIINEAAAKMNSGKRTGLKLD